MKIYIIIGPGPVFRPLVRQLKLSKLWDPNCSFNYLKQTHFLSQCFENLLKQGTWDTPDLGLSQTAVMNIVTHKTVKNGLRLKIKVILFHSLPLCILLFSFLGHCDVTPQVHIPVTSPAYCFVTLKYTMHFEAKLRNHKCVRLKL